MALTTRQISLVDGAASSLREIRDADIEGIDKIRAADDIIRTLLDSMALPALEALGDVYEQILRGVVWNA